MFLLLTLCAPAWGDGPFYVRVTGSAGQTSSSFDGYLANMNGGIPGTPMVPFSKTSSSVLTKATLDIEGAFGFRVFDDPLFLWELEALFLPLKKKYIKSVGYQGAFQNIFPGVSPRLINQKIDAKATLSNRLGVGSNFGVKLTENTFFLGRFHVTTNTFHYETRLFEPGALDMRVRMKKRLYAFEVGVGARHQLSQSIWGEILVGYHWLRPVKFSDVHPEVESDYRPVFKQTGWKMSVGLIYKF